MRDEIVINDRWGKETRSKHGGFYTSEYETFVPEGAQMGPAHKWEEDQGIGKSFGYNRKEDRRRLQIATALIHLLVNAVTRGGNFLLDIGPTADGRIPVIMQERLLQIGAWLKVNGEAIYGTHPWRQMSEGDVRYTSKGNTVYAIALSLARPGIGSQRSPNAPPRPRLRFSAGSSPLKWRPDGGKLHIEVPALFQDQRWLCLKPTFSS